MPLNTKEIHFKPSLSTCSGDSIVCEYCGIGSFEHIHRVGTLPKDFEMVKNDNEILVNTILETKNKEILEAEKRGRRQYAGMLRQFFRETTLKSWESDKLADYFEMEAPLDPKGLFHKTDGTKCWCNPKVVSFKKPKVVK